MNWYGSGFITIINYASTADAPGEAFELITENNIDILTELSQELLIESAP